VAFSQGIRFPLCQMLAVLEIGMGIRELLVSTMRDYNKRSAIDMGLSRNVVRA
jgi:hypothetical protein